IDFDGQEIPKGQQAITVIGAANRDPDEFPDPERFDITRTNLNHVAFGAGIHFCLGAPLARLEAQIAFEQLAARARSIDLLSDETAYRDHFVLRGLASLPVRVTAA